MYNRRYCLLFESLKLAQVQGRASRRISVNYASSFQAVFVERYLDFRRESRIYVSNMHVIEYPV